MIKFDDLTENQQKEVEGFGYSGLFNTMNSAQDAYDYAQKMIDTFDGDNKVAAFTLLHCMINTMAMENVTNYEVLKVPRQLWYFSFGHGQKHFGKYMKIFGTFNEARQIMFDRVGDKFCGQYDSGESLGIGKWDLEELVWPQQ